MFLTDDEFRKRPAADLLNDEVVRAATGHRTGPAAVSMAAAGLAFTGVGWEWQGGGRRGEGRGRTSEGHQLGRDRFRGGEVRGGGPLLSAAVVGVGD